jgi:hypothetical protein
LRFESDSGADGEIATLGGASTTSRATFATWIKIGKEANSGSIFQSIDGASFLRIQLFTGGNGQSLRVSNHDATLDVQAASILRDPTAHHHIVVILDGTAAPGQRCKIYINGVLQSTQLYVDTATLYHVGGAYTHRMMTDSTGNADFIDGYLSQTQFTVGQSNTIDDFGQFGPSGIWVPKQYTGTYGASGFLLMYDDDSSGATLGMDSSGNGHNWTLSSMAVPPNIDISSVEDTPSNNFATLSPIALGDALLENGNLRIQSTVFASQSRLGTVSQSVGKWYMEMNDMGSIFTAFGWRNTLSNLAENEYPGGTPGSYGASQDNTTLTSYTGGIAGGTTPVVTGVIRCAIDFDAGKIWLGSEAAWIGGGDPALGTLPTYTFIANTLLVPHVSAYGGFARVNFGQQPFATAPPTGFKTLCSNNMTENVMVLSGSFEGNAVVNGPFVWIGGNPDSLTINSNAVTFASHADKTAGGFKLRTASGDYNAVGTNTFVVTVAGKNFNLPNPAQINP